MDRVSATPTANHLNAVTYSLFHCLLMYPGTLCFIFQYDCVSANIIRIWSQKFISQTQVLFKTPFLSLSLALFLFRIRMWSRRYLIEFGFLFQFVFLLFTHSLLSDEKHYGFETLKILKWKMETLFIRQKWHRDSMRENEQ